ncbi:sensor histidine kinase [Thalassiella azotivora]
MCQLVVDLALVPVYLTVVVLTLVGVGTTPVAGAGLLLLALAALMAFLAGYLERARLAAFVGVDVEAPPAPRDTTSFWRRYVVNGRPWKALLHVTAMTVWGTVAGTTVLVAASACLAATLLPLYAAALPEPWVARLPGGRELAGAEVWFASLSGLVGLLVVVPLTAWALSRVDVALVRWLLGAGHAEEIDALSERVVTLTATREATVDSVELERRRIERDLHDGPQQRLVAIAMDLGMARQRLGTDPDGARELIDKAHSSAKEAITEMRQVARGIHPPVLTDRGLDAALSALAARSPVPVTVDVRLPARPSPTLEAIAYFCVSEALTNVAKHSRATRAGVHVRHDGGALVVDVTDNGAGGARVGAGTGLVGLQRRVAAVDGRLDVHSPPGGPTRLTLWMPWAATRPVASPPPAAAQPTAVQPPAPQPPAPHQPTTSGSTS